MADWDAKSPELLRNLDEVGRKVNAAARNREPLSSQAIREWQTLIMRGLTPTGGEPFGVFRGEAGLEDYVVEIGDHLGALPEDVARELAQFDRKLTERLNDLDDTIQCEPFDEPTEDDLESVIILCAWAPRRVGAYSSFSQRQWTHCTDSGQQHRAALRLAGIHGYSPQARVGIRADCLGSHGWQLGSGKTPVQEIVRSGTLMRI